MRFHVAGVLINAIPAHAEAVARETARLTGALVHAQAGRQIVVTLESDESQLIVDNLRAIHGIPGVLSAVLVYEHSEPLADTDEEIAHDA